MEEDKRKARVTRTSDKRSPRGIRRLGQALIALAQAQAEAEAQAQAEAKDQRSIGRSGTAPSPPPEDHARPTGDAA